jgi:hypothetical protein
MRALENRLRFLIRAFFHDTCVVCKRDEIAQGRVGAVSTAAARFGSPHLCAEALRCAGTERLPYVY